MAGYKMYKRGHKRYKTDRMKNLNCSRNNRNTWECKRSETFKKCNA